MSSTALAIRLGALVIARSVSDEAIQSGNPAWIASLHYVALAMTNRSRGAFFPLPPPGGGEGWHDLSSRVPGAAQHVMVRC